MIKNLKAFLPTFSVALALLAVGVALYSVIWAGKANEKVLGDRSSLQMPFNLISGTSTMGGILVPDEDNAVDIGRADLRFQDVYGVNFIGSGSLSTSGTIAVGTSGTLNATSTIYHGLEIGTRDGFLNGGLNIDPSGNLRTSGTIYLSDGTDTAPSLTFGSDKDLGLYRAAENTLALVVGGAVKGLNDATNFTFGTGGGGTVAIRHAVCSPTVPGIFSTDYSLTGWCGRGNNRQILIANGTERVRLDELGTFRIGTGTDSSITTAAKLQVVSDDTHNGIEIYNSVTKASSTFSENHFSLNATAANASGTFYVDSSGNTYSSGTLTSFGTAGTNANDYVCVDTKGLFSPKATACTGSSARELKDNIQDLEVDVDNVLALKPRTYTRKNNGVKEVGLIVDEVAPLIPSMIVKDESGTPYGVEYSQLPIYLLKVFQEQQKQIEELKTLLGQTESRVGLLQQSF